MSRHKTTLLLVLILLNSSYLAFSQLTEPAASLSPARSLSPAVVQPLFSSLLSSFPEDLEISDYCKELLDVFGQRYVAFVSCLIPAARPIKVCQNCFSKYRPLEDIYRNISSDQFGAGNESCGESLLHSDRLMLVYQLYSNLQDLWTSSNCDKCIDEHNQTVTNTTMKFISTLNQTLACFEKYQLGNRTELCKNCKPTYRAMNELYRQMEKDQAVCIDIEDAMNMTRRLWSKNFNCSLPRDETVPVIAVSTFMLFLLIIFYLSSFLHSEQKKRKLIHPNRAKTYTSLMNIQDKQS